VGFFLENAKTGFSTVTDAPLVSRACYLGMLSSNNTDHTLFQSVLGLSSFIDMRNDDEFEPALYKILYRTCSEKLIAVPLSLSKRSNELLHEAVQYDTLGLRQPSILGNIDLSIIGRLGRASRHEAAFSML
jgi:hypothetical protein